MPRFNESQKNELEEFIYNSNIHDATILSSSYNREDKTLFIHSFNSFFHSKLTFSFLETKVIHLCTGNEFGDSSTILSLTVEDDNLDLKVNPNVNDYELEGCIHVLFQMFSGDELHIMAKEILVNSE